MDRNQKVEAFIQRYKNLEIDPSIEPMSTWQKNLTSRMLSPLVLKRYVKILRLLNVILIGLLIISLIAISILVIKFTFFYQKEMIFFEDGTDITCIYNPETGEIKQNDEK